MLKGSIPFPTSKRINLADLDAQLALAMGWKRHASIEDKDCFCGINMVQDRFNGEPCKVIQIVWTDDGVNGYVKKTLTERELDKIIEEVGKHNG